MIWSTGLAIIWLISVSRYVERTGIFIASPGTTVDGLRVSSICLWLSTMPTMIITLSRGFLEDSEEDRGIY